MTRYARAVILAVAVAAFFSEARADREPATIESLEDREFEVLPDNRVVDSKLKARDNYRAFLDLVSNDPELRAEAMRRLADLELEATERADFDRHSDAYRSGAFDDAIALFKTLLESYPEYRRSDTVLYQLARAYETAGQTDQALATLNQLVERHPESEWRDEVEFRRGEMLFLRKKYQDAEVAYRYVIQAGEASRFFEQSLYKLGWTLFKQARHEESYDPFFNLLDRKFVDANFVTQDSPIAVLGRAERELVNDTLRATSIGFSYGGGAERIAAYFAVRGAPPYRFLVYQRLGDLYLEKERYVDAAHTYEAFSAVDPVHPKAPTLHALVIDAYDRGGFASLVLESKKSFVERYGLDQPFWQHNAALQNADAIADLKANLTDLARFYHAAAQRDRRPDDFQQAAYWYRKYLGYFPNEPGSANTHFLLAEILFESGDFAAATAEYESAAYGFPHHDRSAEAAYAALLAYRRHEATLAGAERDAWHRRYLDSALRYATAHPEHAEAANVLTSVAEDLFSQQQFDLAITVAQNVVNRAPPPAAGILRTCWAVIAHAQFDLARYDLAERSYYALQAYTPDEDSNAQQQIRDRVASSIFKQGEAARSRGDIEAAVAHFRRVAVAVPDSPIRATAEFDAAAALIQIGAWQRAIEVLEDLRRDLPDNDHAADVTRNLAVAYLKAGDSAKAAAEFERVASDQSVQDDLRRDAWWQAAGLYQDSGYRSDEVRVLESIVALFPKPFDAAMEARFRLLELAEAVDDTALVYSRLRQIKLADAAAGADRTDRSRYLAAMATLRLAEPLRERFVMLSLEQPLATSLAHKKSAMEELVAAYADAVEYGLAMTTTAATYRLGEVYQHFAQALLQSERPANLDALALEEYELLLEEQAYPFEEQAIEFHRANSTRAANGLYDEWVRRSYVALADLLPARYAKQERSEDVLTALY